MKKIVILLLSFLIFTGCGKEKEKATDETIRWINGTYAVFTVTNKGDIEKVGGFDKTDKITQSTREMLSEWWGVNNREDADAALSWLLNNGHKQDFLKTYYNYEIQNYNRDSLNEALKNASKEDKVYFTLLFDAHEKFGDDAITAWDFSRAVQLLGYYYLADYYTYEEAMDISLGIAKQIQNTFNSWDDFMQSYLYGFQYWNEDDVKEKGSGSYNRAETYKKIKEMKNSPYELEWKMELKKSW